MNTERRSKTKRGVLVVILLLCLVALIGGTYARYSTGGNVNATVGVAKWAIKIGGENASSQTITKNVTFTLDTNTNVVANKIAPGRTATATIALNFEGTETDVEVNAKVNKADISGEGYPDFSLTTKINNGTAVNDTTFQKIAMDSATGFNSSDKNVVLTLVWNNGTDTVDTAFGAFTTDTKTITIPVTLTVRQYMQPAN